jgi:hypothetical protein
VARKYGFKILRELPDVRSIGDLNAGLLKEYTSIFEERIGNGVSVRKIYYIRGIPCERYTTAVAPRDIIYVAGSKALVTFREQASKMMIGGRYNFDEERSIAFGESFNKGRIKQIKQFNEFKAQDTDLFILKSNVESRMTICDVDVITSKATSISDLLENNFDLPPCQIAIDYKGDFIMTAHCLYSLISFNYFMHPKLSCLDCLCGVPDSTLTFVKDKIHKDKLPQHLQGCYDRLILGKLNKVQARIKKYKTRGFSPLPYDVVETSLIPVLHLNYYETTFYTY